MTEVALGGTGSTFHHFDTFLFVDSSHTDRKGKLATPHICDATSVQSVILMKANCNISYERRLKFDRLSNPYLCYKTPDIIHCICVYF